MTQTDSLSSRWGGVTVASVPDSGTDATMTRPPVVARGNCGAWGAVKADPFADDATESAFIDAGALVSPRLVITAAATTPEAIQRHMRCAFAARMPAWCVCGARRWPPLVLCCWQVAATVLRLLRPPSPRRSTLAASRWTYR